MKILLTFAIKAITDLELQSDVYLSVKLSSELYWFQMHIL